MKDEGGVAVACSCVVGCTVSTIYGTSLEGGVDACHRALSASFFIARGAIHLTCHKQIPDYLRFQRVVELCGIEEIILYRIAWSIHLQVSKGWNLLEGIYLDVHW